MRRGRLGRLELRGEIAHVFVDQADELNRLRALREGVDPNIASQMFGAYLEAAHPILPLPSPREVVGSSGYERFDTQFRIPPGTSPSGHSRAQPGSMGVSYFPIPTS